MNDPSEQRTVHRKILDAFTARQDHPCPISKRLQQKILASYRRRSQFQDIEIGMFQGIEPLPLFDPVSLGAIAIGERTGTLDEALIRLADEATESAVRRCRALALAGVVLVTGLAFAIILKGLLSVILGPIADYFRQIGDI